MEWQLFDQFPPDQLTAGRCLRCQVTELNRPNQPAPDRAITTVGQFPIDIGGETVYYDAQVSFCESCIGEVAALLGWIHPDKADELRRKNRDLGAENKRLREKLDKFEVAAALQAEAAAL